MDISALLSALMGDDKVEQVSRSSGVSENEVRGVLSSVLPALLGGASEDSAAQNASKETGLSLNKIQALFFH